MSEKKYPIKWEAKSHSCQIADTGDYDGYWEITNGKDSLITKDDYEDIEKDLQELANLLNDIYPNFTIDRGNEAALEAENKWLKSELERLKAQPGPGWVRAERTLPAPGTYNAKKDGKPFVLKFMEADKRLPKDYWKGVEWLDDESPTEQPVADNARYELRLALRDMIKLAKHIGSSITNYNQFEQRIEAAEAMLKKHSKITDILRTEAHEQPVRYVEFEGEFAEWLYKNRWFHFENGRWEYTFEMGSSVSRGEYLKNYIKTTAQLYQLFKGQKQPPAEWSGEKDGKP